MAYVSDLPSFEKPLTAKVIEIIRPKLVFRPLFQVVKLEPGSSFYYFEEHSDQALGLAEIPKTSEGAWPVQDYMTISKKIVYEPPEYKKTFKLSMKARRRIPGIDLAKLQLQQIAKDVAYTMDKAAKSVIDAAIPDAHKISKTGKMSENETVTGAIGKYDLLEAMKKVQEDGFMPTDLLMNPVDVLDLAKFTQFSSREFFPEADLRRAVEFPKILGMTLRVSSMVDQGKAYIIARETLTPAYRPFGFWCVAEPVEVRTTTDLEERMIKFHVYFQEGPLLLSPNAIALIQ
mgnify:CR=1 FL=1